MSADDCPGKSKCRVWKKSKKCEKCPRGKFAPAVVDKEFEGEACAAVEALALERQCGRVLSPEVLSPIEWELLLVWVDREKQHERAYMKELTEMGFYVKAFIGAGKK